MLCYDQVRKPHDLMGIVLAHVADAGAKMSLFCGVYSSPLLGRGLKILT